MIVITESRSTSSGSTSVVSDDLEDFWVEELEKASNLSYRLAILLTLRKNLPKRWFARFIRNTRFTKWIEECDRQFEKWDDKGRPPSEETLIAFVRLTGGITYEDVLEQALEEALSRPTLRKTDYEAKREMCFRKRALEKKIYRVKKALEAGGIPIKHQTKVSKKFAEFIEKIRLAEAKKVDLSGLRPTQHGSLQHRH